MKLADSTGRSSTKSLSSEDKREPAPIPARDAANDVGEIAVRVDPEDQSLLDLIADEKPVISAMVSNDDAVAYVDIMDALQVLGVDTVAATRFVCRSKATDPVTFME